MNLEERKKIIMDIMKDKHYTPMKFKELAILLNVKKEDRKDLDFVLSELMDEGKIMLSKRGKYSIPKEQYVEVMREDSDLLRQTVKRKIILYLNQM